MMEMPFNKTKIIATVGPACSSREKLLELVVAGVDVFRLNFSHGAHEEHLQVIHAIRSINSEFNASVGILLDLQGPKIRIDMMENGGVEIKKDGVLVISTDETLVGNAQRVSCTYQSLARDVKNGDSIFVDDGKIELKVVKIEKNEVHTQVVNGGILKSKKGMNLPDTKISAPSVTKKDLHDLLFGLEHNVEWVALSFVRRADDIVGVKEIIAEKGKQTRVIAKIERPEAITNIDSIIEATDAIMVARGDLGVEVKMEDVPILQKKIVEKCNKEAKPVIIATQMMESMIVDPRPTRAEASDVANSVFDGADAVMLSGETAVGKHPLKVIQSMVKIIQACEESESIYNKFYKLDQSREDFTSCSIISTACRLANDTHAKAIISMTQSGYTAFRIASHRPKAGICIFTGNKSLLNMVSLIWGVRGFFYDKFESTDATFADTERILVSKNLLHKGDVCIQTASMPIHDKSKTNALKISIVK